MHSRTDSESVRTSRPSTWAEPPLSGRSPVSILMTVVLPLPLGPRKPNISPFSTRKLTSFTAVKLPKRRTRCSAEMAGSARSEERRGGEKGRFRGGPDHLKKKKKRRERGSDM